MNFESNSQEEIGEKSNYWVSPETSVEIDLLNYSNSKTKISSSSGSDKSSSQLDLLLKPSELNKLVSLSPVGSECNLLEPLCGVAKKPGFYLKQDMKTTSGGKFRKYQEESECVLESLLPRVPSRCRNNCSSHSLLSRDLIHFKNEKRDLLRECSNTDLAQYEVESDCGSKCSFHDHLVDTGKLKKRKICNFSVTNLLSDEWMRSLNPKLFSEMRDKKKLSSVSLHDEVHDETNNMEFNSLFDFTIPFYRKQNTLLEREVERDIRSLGFNNHTEIDWDSLYHPKRRDVLRLIHYRLCNHISPDIVVVLDDKEFFCHRILLQSYSEFFDDLKYGDGIQRVDLSNKTITENAFLTIYTWMLTVGQGGFQLLTIQNILEVLLACQKLRIKDFENQCLSFLDNEEIFTEEKAYFLYGIAVDLNMKSIQELMVPRVRNFFLVLVSSKDFNELSVDSVIAFLESSNIGVHCELEVFFSAVRWLRYDYNTRKEHLVRVMECVRFNQMTPIELVDLRKTEQIEISEIVNNEHVIKFIDEGLAMAVKSTLGQENDEIDHSFINHTPPRNLIGKHKTYKSYNHFIEFIRDVKVNPQAVLTLEKRDIYRSNVSECSEKIKNYNVHISDKSVSHLTDSGITSKSCSNAKLSENLKMRKLDVSTNTIFDVKDFVSPCYFNELVIEKLNERLEEMKSTNLPLAKLSEPAIQKKSRISRPRLRDQAATIIQAAFRGHLTRLKLINTLSFNSKNSSKTVSKESCVKSLQKSDNSIESFGFLTAPLECTRNLSSHTIFSCLVNSEPKLLEELTSNGSTFHLVKSWLLVIGGLDPTSHLGAGNTGCEVYRYICDKNKWEIFGKLPEPRYYHSVVMHKGKVFIAGGVDPKQEDLNLKAVSKVVWSLDPKVGIWQREADMQTERKNFGFVSVGNFLYAIGGNDNDSRLLSSVERYDPVVKKWCFVASLENGKTGAAVCKHNHMIWVAGGISGSGKHQVIKEVECYDPKRDVWMAKRPLRFGRAFSQLVSVKGNLYLVGGASKRSSTAATSTPAIDIWDERNKEWKLKTEMSIARHNHSVSNVGSQIVIIGGTTTMSMRCITTVESWCVNRGSWTRGITSLPAPLIGHATVTIPLDSTESFS